MRKLLKALQTQAQILNISEQKLFEAFVEVQYQYVNAGVVSNDLFEYQDACTKLTTAYLNIVKKKPFRDVLGDVMAEINLLKNSVKSKHCQHFTPPEVADALSQMVHANSNKQNTFSDIACGSGALILATLKNHFMSGSNQAFDMVLNDLDEFIGKVAVIQIEYTNLIHIQSQFEISYIIYNHDALLEYSHFATNGLTTQTKVVGCSSPTLITNAAIRKAKGSDEANLSAMLLRSLNATQALNKELVA